MNFILASSSPTRLQLLKQIGFVPSKIIAPEIDEKRLKGEKPAEMATRLSFEKAEAVFLAQKIENGVILAADSVLVAGGKILHKAENENDVRSSMKAISGKKHVAHCGICVLKIENSQILQMSKKLISSSIKTKRLSEQEIEEHVENGEGIGKAGGYSIFGASARFFSEIYGSPSAIAGLALCETSSILRSFGLKSSV